ncbi:hypothetical protein QUW13_10425 [Enterococcus hirae]|nr:hypothetical protein [Enterococcus hirae]
MKKSTKFFLLIGIIMVVFGGIGAALRFPAAEKKYHQAVQHSYQYAAETLTLDLNNHATYHITQDDSLDGRIKVHTNYSPVNGRPQIKQTVDALQIKYKRNQEEKIQLFQFGSFSPQITITLPQNVKNLSLKSSTSPDQVVLSDLNKEVTVDSSFNSLSIHDCDFSALTVKKTAGYLSLINTKAAVCTVDEKLTDLELSEAAVTEGTFKKEIKNLRLAESSGKLTFAALGDSTSSIRDFQGDLAIEATDLNLEMNGTFEGSGKIQTKKAEASLYLEPQQNLRVEPSSKYGNVIRSADESAFNDENAKSTLAIQTDYGDITFNN